ncbi:Clp protease/crotonase-like domain-containing protein, partial [Aquimarina macrocephali]|uniref:hypothetical protein n=1 Tax=Aquimarina macrocephali TaxID=666563 RepID=UPI0019D3C469
MSFPVLSRKNIYTAALTLARQIARQSRSSLVAIKDQLTGHLKGRLEETYSRELAMHEKTFVGRSDTLQQIESNFHQENTDSKREITSVTQSTSFTAQHTDTLPDIITE